MTPASIFALTVLAAVPALAQNTLSWVSQRSGSDLNPCTVALPCQTFQGAYNKTNSGGTIQALDAGEYGYIGIYKPLTLDGNNVATVEGGLFVSNSSGVVIRNLVIHMVYSTNTVDDGIDSYGNVTIENVAIVGSPNNGVHMLEGTATLRGVTISGARNAGILMGGDAFSTSLTITDSAIQSSEYAIFMNNISASFTSQALITNTKLTNNFIGVLAGNYSTAQISGNAITQNHTGIVAYGTAAQIVTLQNNTLIGNTTDGSATGIASLK
jgi:hypothetical protein